MKEVRADESYPRVEKVSFLLEAVEWRDDKRFIVLCFSRPYQQMPPVPFAPRLNCISVFIATAKHISFVRAPRMRRENARAPHGRSRCA
ncbi:hypothetical protein [Caballeronia sp. INDeC2]|uniref:hypothetical protein n=1 Tax=Caballeronia sp. INDeC2 TaxID=2921747 RepID=UPI0020280AE7|nr:hypothetical protein [Caballeronia sp. INDeC2]